MSKTSKYEALCIGGPLSRQFKACECPTMIVPVMRHVLAAPLAEPHGDAYDRVTYRFTRLATFDDGRFVDAWLPEGTSVADAALHVFATWRAAS